MKRRGDDLLFVRKYLNPINKKNKISFILPLKIKTYQPDLYVSFYNSIHNLNDVVRWRRYILRPSRPIYAYALFRSRSARLLPLSCPIEFMADIERPLSNWSRLIADTGRRKPILRFENHRCIVYRWISCT